MKYTLVRRSSNYNINDTRRAVKGCDNREDFNKVISKFMWNPRSNVNYVVVLLSNGSHTLTFFDLHNECIIHKLDSGLIGFDSDSEDVSKAFGLLSNSLSELDKEDAKWLSDVIFKYIKGSVMGEKWLTPPVVNGNLKDKDSVQKSIDIWNSCKSDLMKMVPNRYHHFAVFRESNG